VVLVVGATAIAVETKVTISTHLALEPFSLDWLLEAFGASYAFVFISFKGDLV